MAGQVMEKPKLMSNSGGCGEKFKAGKPRPFTPVFKFSDNCIPKKSARGAVAGYGKK